MIVFCVVFDGSIEFCKEAAFLQSYYVDCYAANLKWPSCLHRNTRITQNIAQMLSGLQFILEARWGIVICFKEYV